MENSGYSADASCVVARVYDQISSRYDSHDEVCRQIGQRLLDRLDLLAIKPRTVLDLGCGTGYLLPRLLARYKKSRVIGVDISANMLAVAASRARWWRKPRLILADGHDLPLATNSVDLIVSNQMLPWCHSPHQVFAEMYRVLSPGGAVMFSACGPDTLMEYSKLWQAVDGGIHSFGLFDMHDLGDSMLGNGFLAPVLDRENMTVDYPSIMALEQELRCTGAVNVAFGRRRGLMGSSLRTRVQAEVKSAGRFPVSLELVQGHAWKGESKKVTQPENNEYRVSIDQIRQGIRKK